MTATYAGTVYLLHLDRPLAAGRNQHGAPQAAHYLGWTASRTATRRVGLHARGRSGSKYMAAALREGIGFRLVRTWSDMSRDDERKLKNRKSSGRLCPVCTGRAATPLPRAA